MKVLIINSLYPPYAIGGAERSVALLAHALAHAQVRVTVLTLTQGAGETVQRDGVRVITRPLRNLYWSFGTPRSVLKIAWHVVDTFNPLMLPGVHKVIEEEKPDVVHTNNFAGFSVAAWLAARRAGRPVLHTLRDCYLLCPRYLFRNGRACSGGCLNCRPFRVPHKALSRVPEAVVGISRNVLDRHRRAGYFPAARFETVIGNPCDFEVSSPRPDSKPESPRCVRFGYLGRLDATKGIALLLNQMQDLPAGRWRLSIAGRGASEYERSLRRLARLEVEFLGWVEPDTLFSRIDVLVVPSLLPESFGRGVIEAYARGIPVIVSNRGGLPELVDPSATGFVFDPDRPQELRAILQGFIDGRHDATSMAPACRDRVRPFAPDRVAAEYVRLYEAII